MAGERSRQKRPEGTHKEQHGEAPEIDPDRRPMERDEIPVRRVEDLCFPAPEAQHHVAVRDGACGPRLGRARKLELEVLPKRKDMAERGPAADGGDVHGDEKDWERGEERVGELGRQRVVVLGGWVRGEDVGSGEVGQRRRVGEDESRQRAECDPIERRRG